MQRMMAHTTEYRSIIMGHNYTCTHSDMGTGLTVNKYHNPNENVQMPAPTLTITH